MTGAGGDSGGWLETAISVLGEMQEWHVTQNQWERVSQRLEELELAVASGHDLAAEQAAMQLELAGPFRVIRAGSSKVAPVTGPVPGPVRERTAELIHTLEARLAPSEDADAAPGLPDKQAGATQ
jgi:hypothetical protein